MPDSSTPYRGRFAPSPSGPLHLGSLIAAVASYLDARKNSGAWLLRMDDLDPPREIAGAAELILAALQRHGLHWDEEVLWQSNRDTAYQSALKILDEGRKTFRCRCTRATLAADGSCCEDCREHAQPAATPCSIRIAVPAEYCIAFNDQLQGPQKFQLGHDEANFLVHRRDGLYAYQLAVVVDDAHQRITHILRGSDLLSTTARQIYLQHMLGHTTPAYCHIPVITNEQGQKFSKQHHAPVLDDNTPVENLRAALAFLRQPSPPQALTSPAQILSFATIAWSVGNIPPTLAIEASLQINPL